MRVYQVDATINGTVVASRYGATAVDSKDKRDELMGKYNISKKAVTIEQVEIATAKPDLLAFINELATKSDQGPDENEAAE